MIEQLSAYMSSNVPSIMTTVVIVIYIFILVKWQVSVDSFDMRSVLVDGRTGTVSLHKFCQVTALLISTCAIMHELFNGRLTEWLFAGYMVAWAGSNAVSKWIDSKNDSNERHGHRHPGGDCPPADGGPA